MSNQAPTEDRPYVTCDGCDRKFDLNAWGELEIVGGGKGGTTLVGNEATTFLIHVRRCTCGQVITLRLPLGETESDQRAARTAAGGGWARFVETEDAVNRPSHYTAHPSGIEAITICEHFGFNLGNVMKYIWRAGLKRDAPTLQDLEKAAWYLAREIARLEKPGQPAVKAPEAAIGLCGTCRRCGRSDVEVRQASAEEIQRMVLPVRGSVLCVDAGACRAAALIRHASAVVAGA